MIQAKRQNINIILKSSLMKNETLSVVLEESSFKETNSMQSSMQNQNEVNMNNTTFKEQDTTHYYFNTMSESKIIIKEENNLTNTFQTNKNDSQSTCFIYENINFRGVNSSRKHFRSCRFCLLLKVILRFNYKNVAS